MSPLAAFSSLAEGPATSRLKTSIEALAEEGAQWCSVRLKAALESWVRVLLVRFAVLMIFHPMDAV